MGRSFTMKPLNETETTLTRSTSQMRDHIHTSGKPPTLVENHSDEKPLGLVTLSKPRVHTDTYLLSISDFFFYLSLIPSKASFFVGIVVMWKREFGKVRC